MLISHCLFILITFTTFGASWKYFLTFFNAMNFLPCCRVKLSKPCIPLKQSFPYESYREYY